MREADTLPTEPTPHSPIFIDSDYHIALKSINASNKILYEIFYTL